MPDMNELQHWGINGMKWGLRRYQNPDGTLTELGRIRYGNTLNATKGQVKRDLNKLDKESQSAKERAKDYTQRALEREEKHKIFARRKAEKLLKTANEYRKLVERDEAFKNLILSQVSKYSSMTVKEIPTVRKVELADAFKDVLFNPHKIKTEGMRYKVRNDIPEIISDEIEHGCLAHHGILGQKWGVRRFQNPDGTLTDEGKKRYRIGINNLSERRNKEKDANIIQKIKSNKPISDEEKKALEESINSYIDENYSLSKELWSIKGSRDISELSNEDQKIANDLTHRISENRKSIADASYYKSLNKKNEYDKEIKNETDGRFIDPACKNFSNKTDKSEAEKEYLNFIWQQDLEDYPEDPSKLEREILHLDNAVIGLSMDGYQGIPKSERQKALFDYVDDDNPFDTYENWIPKYKNSKEWKDLQTERNKIANEIGLNEIRKTYESTGNRSWKEFKKISKAYGAKIEEYETKTADIYKKERKIEKDFENKILENVLLDMGYEVNQENMDVVKYICMYD